jgi:putative membrane-bound dehydrogenase-like protein
MYRSVAFAVACLIPVFVAGLSSLAVEPPRLLDSDWQIELISSEPELVTPTGCCFDDAGRLLVIECHTHFPPDDYKGPKTDRIYLFDDSDGDGVLDRQRLFYEGGVATMNVANIGDGWIAVATRSEIVRIRDSDKDDVADQREVLLKHETTAVYPHNGLGGLTFGPDGWLYVGQGENFGEPYELIGTDGSKQIGGGEGGNVYRCKPDGSQLERVATGFWNPFGLCCDVAKRLWVVGNDPDAMPPNRLLHVVTGGDYGFQFRFGRAGTHPLLAWNGEIPGTLPMAAGTGEAACSVITHGKHLWVTSWGDNRIESYTIKPRGASWSGERTVVVQGDANFRPVGMAVAADGSIYLTDWVDRSYKVHGKGRLWRISRRVDADPVADSLPRLTELEKEALRLRGDSEITANERLKSLLSDDVFIRQAATTGLVQTNQLAELGRPKLPRQSVGLISAWRWKELSNPGSVSADQRRQLLEWGLNDESDDVLIAAIRWATERNCQDQLPAIRNLLERRKLAPAVFSAVIGSIAYLETGSASGGRRDPASEKLLVEFAGNPDRRASLRALAIRRLPVEADVPSDEQLGQWMSGQHDRVFASEVVRLLAARGTKTSSDQLAKVAADESFDVQTRADALAGLSRQAGTYAALVNKLSRPTQPDVLRQEAQRILKRAWKTDNKPRPPREDVDAWNQLVGSGGDPDAGRRVFSRTTCINCHAHSGRGATTGPELTTLSGQMTSHRLLESILLPSKEVGPLYVPWRVLTVDGKVLTGLKLDESGVGNRIRFQGADGNTFDVALKEIEVQEPITQSIMPNGLEDAMTIDELRDLVAFLVSSD